MVDDITQWEIFCKNVPHHQGRWGILSSILLLRGRYHFYSKNLYGKLTLAHARHRIINIIKLISSLKY